MPLISTNQEVSLKTIMGVIVMMAGIVVMGLFLFLYTRLSARPKVVLCPAASVEVVARVDPARQSADRLALVALTDAVATKAETYARAVQKSSSQATAIQKLVRTRKTRLVTYLSEDPSSTAALALSPSAREVTKTLTAGCVESDRRVQGFVEVLAGEYWLHDEAGHQYQLFLTTAGQEGLFTGAKISVRGMMVDNFIFVVTRSSIS